MNTNTVLNILSGVVAVTIGVVTIWLALRKRYPGQITYLEDTCIGLFDSIVRNLPDLKVLYRGDPVSQSVVLIKGYLVNTGSKDIERDMIEKPLTLKLPDGFEWLDAKVVQSGSAVQAQLQIKEATSAEFDLGLFRVDEYVKFEALAKVPTEDLRPDSVKVTKSATRLQEELVVEHRIADSDRVIKSKIPSSPPLGFLIAMLTIGLILLSLTFLGLFGALPSYRELHYFIEDSSGQTVETKIELENDETLVVKGIDHSMEERQPIVRFFEGCNFTPKAAEKSPWLHVLALSAIPSVWMLSFAILGYGEYRRKRKFRKILSAEQIMSS